MCTINERGDAIQTEAKLHLNINTVSQDTMVSGVRKSLSSTMISIKKNRGGGWVGKMAKRDGR